MKARIGYIEKHVDYGDRPRFKKFLERFDTESDWIRIVYFEVEE